MRCVADVPDHSTAAIPREALEDLDGLLQSCFVSKTPVSQKGDSLAPSCQSRSGDSETGSGSKIAEVRLERARNETHGLPSLKQKSRSVSPIIPDFPCKANKLGMATNKH